MKVFNRGTMPMKAWIIMKPQNWQVEISPRHVKYLCNLFWKAVPTQWKIIRSHGKLALVC